MKKAYIYVLLGTILFSTMEVTLKTMAGDFHPIQMTMTRFLVGGLFLLPLAHRALRQRQLRIHWRDVAKFSGLGFCCVVVSMVFYQLAVINANASVVAVLFSANPVFMTLFAYLLLHEHIHRLNLIALGLEILGILIIINPLNTHISTSGILFTLLATITFPLYGALGKKQSHKFGGIVITCASAILGALELLLLTLIARIPAVAAFLSANGLSLFVDVPLFSGYTAANILPVLYVFIFVTGGGYACYFMAMESASTTTASLIFFFKPILASLLAFLFLHEPMPLNMLLGILFVLGGSIASIRGNQLLAAGQLPKQKERA